MKIKTIEVSNILSFKYFESYDDYTSINFEDDLNILIGENGAGKSTALEIINFIFKKVLFTNFSLDENSYNQRASLNARDRKNIVTAATSNSYAGFRLDKNWNYSDKPQTIRFTVELDEADKSNIEKLKVNDTYIRGMLDEYTSLSLMPMNIYESKFAVTISLNADNQFSTSISSNAADAGYTYLTNYNLYRSLINLYNRANPEAQIDNLVETFTLISSYRNYNAFVPSVSLQASTSAQQLKELKDSEYTFSLNSVFQDEPTIFRMVRLYVAEKHYELYDIASGNTEAEDEANKVLLLEQINKRLEIINIKCKVRLVEKRTWSYAFEMLDLARNRVIEDINSLSAGQKAIMHLVFEAYGRGTLKGGLVVIDEPEIHLHYQFQNEYLQVIKDINREQKCQYILVTHSESLINSETISSVKRLALNADKNTVVMTPSLSNDQKTLVKILDNTRSTYAFFAKKVLLVEGDTDRYFIKAVIWQLGVDSRQTVAVIDIGGKSSYEKWRAFFEDFGLEVYFIGDFDNVYNLKIAGTTLVDKTDESKIRSEAKQDQLDKLTKSQKDRLKAKYNILVADDDFLGKPKMTSWRPLLDDFTKLSEIPNGALTKKTLAAHPGLEAKIEATYEHNIFILKYGVTEDYIDIKHSDMNALVSFCNKDLLTWLNTDRRSTEIKTILSKIIDT